MIKGVSHVAFRSSDMQKTLDFYCGILGMEDAFDYCHPETGKPWLKFIRAGEGQYLEMLYRWEEGAQSGPYQHICLEVEDIAALAEHLKRHGIPLDKEPSCGVTKNWTCWAADPDGNKIEFIQVMPDSLQAQREGR